MDADDQWQERGKSRRYRRPWMTRMRSRPGAEPISADLRHYRLDPLADRRGAGDHLDSPIAAERDAHIVERAEPA